MFNLPPPPSRQCSGLRLYICPLPVYDKMHMVEYLAPAVRGLRIQYNGHRKREREKEERERERKRGKRERERNVFSPQNYKYP